MEYIVSARKYRPHSFDDVVGQQPLTTTLKNAVSSGKLAHAYLFCGPRGVGKTTCARIFAKAINCQNPTPQGEACNECESCRAFNQGRSLNIFELDAASNNSVDNIKSLMEQTRIPPQVGKYKVFIIDEVHMLSTAAFNAFLKTLEEPPAHVVFILATTEKHKILPTILSRCQIYDFERMNVPDIVSHLKMVAERERYTFQEEALAVIAEKADGGMRDALSIFDQTASFCQGDITYEKVIQNLNVLHSDNYFRIIDLALQNQVPEILMLLNNVLNKGFDGAHLISGLASHVRNVLMAKDEQTLPLLEVSQRQREQFRQQAAKCPTHFLFKALRFTNQCDIQYRQSSNKRLLVELTLIEIAQITQTDDDDSGAGPRPKRLKSLFKKLVAAQPKTALQVAGARHMAKAGKEATTPVNVNDNATTTVKPAVKAPVKMSAIGQTFTNLMKKPEKPSYIKEVEVENKNEQQPFTQEQLEREWIAMCNRMPQHMAAMAQRLKNIKPLITHHPNIELLVDNQILLDQFTTIKGRIRATMAKALHNGDIAFQLRLAKPEEVTKILSKKEIFDDMRQQNPAIERLRELFQLEMA